MGDNISIIIPSKVMNIDWLYSNDLTEQFMCLRTIRRNLSVREANIEAVFKLNIIPRILELMMSRDDAESQMECAWILTNLASGKLLYSQS